MTLARPILCVVTRVRGTAESSERHRLLDRLAAAARAGATLIQVRERQLTDRDLVAFVQDLATRVNDTGARVLVNDRVDIALAAGAHGVHLKSDGLGAADVRPLTPPGFLVGKSVHTDDEARVVSGDGGLDYLLFGTVFHSDTKPDGHRPAGLDALARTCRATRLPVVAIGGIGLEQAADVARAGAAGVAAISLFATAPDLAVVVSRLRDALTVAEGTI